MSDFLESVTRAFAALIDRNQLKVESSKFDAQAFGNAVVVLAAGSFRIRMVRDRDDVFADAASHQYPDEWYPLEWAIRAVGELSMPSDGLLSPVQAAEYVERYYSSLVRGYAEGELEETRRQLALLERQAHKRKLALLKSDPAKRETG